MRLLILGSKEYPLGTNTNDVLQSGGIEFYVQNMVSHLANTNKNELVVVTRRFSKSSSYEKTGIVEIFRVPWVKGFFFRNISFNFMAFLKGLKIEFDLIHSHGPFATFFGLMLSKIKGTSIIATPHGLALQQPQYHSLLRKILATLEKYVYSRADCVVFLSEQEKDGFGQKMGFLPREYRIIYPGIDSKKFDLGNGKRIRKEFFIKHELIITFVGRLIEVKGLKYLIEAANKLKGEFFFLIVGDGAQRKKLEVLVSSLNLDKVIFTGHRSDIPDILAATDIFVLPSLSEGLPMSLLEAMVAGKACIVTDIGLPVKHMQDAIVVRAAVVEDLKEAIKLLLDNQKLRTHLGKEAQHTAKRTFLWKNATKEHLKLFNDLVSEPLNSP